jgi:hypothetical protein
VSLHNVIERTGFKTGDYTVTRYAAATVSVGRVTPGAPSTFSISASIQPEDGDAAGGRKVVVGPEGQSGADIAVVYTQTELRATAGSPDTIAISGETWKVFAVKTWRAFGGVHYVAHIARQAQP